MRRILPLGIALAGVITGVLTGWPRPANSSEPDIDYRAGQTESSTKARSFRARLRAERPQGKSPEAASAFIRKIKEEPIATGTLGSNRGAPDFAIDSFGQLNDQGLEAMRIARTAKPRLQKIVDAAVSQASADMLARVRLDRRRTDSAKGIRAYWIPADVDASKDYLDQAEQDFSTVVNAEQAARLRQNMSSLLNSFGRRGLRIIIRPDEVPGNSRLEFHYIDPLTGFDAGGTYRRNTSQQDDTNPLGSLAQKILAQER